MFRACTLAAILVIVSISGPSRAEATIGNCIGAYKGFDDSKKYLGDVRTACEKPARGGAKLAASLLGTAFFRTGRIADAEAWLRRAAYQGDILAPFLLADILVSKGLRREGAIWAFRAYQRIWALRDVAGNRSTDHIDRLERQARNLMRTDLDRLVEQGRMVEYHQSATLENPFVGRWKIGPNENCNGFYTEIAANGATSVWASRTSEYDDVRFDRSGRRVTLTGAAGTLALRSLDWNTIEVSYVRDGATGKKSGSGVIGTRCN